jgi:hypothetical protein
MGAISNRELARQLGVSETAVRRAEKAAHTLHAVLERHVRAHLVELAEVRPSLR